VKRKSDGKKYVLKEVPIDVDEKDARAKALAEVTFLRRLQHPFVSSVRDYFEIPEMLSIVMKYTPLAAPHSTPATSHSIISTLSTNGRPSVAGTLLGET
jgi:serine/threonine protein kinase